MKHSPQSRQASALQKGIFLSTVLFLVAGGSLDGSIEAADDVPTLRFGFRAVLQAQGQAEDPSFSLTSRQVPGRPPHIGFQYKLLDEANRLFQHGFLQLGTQKQFSLTNCPTRFCLLEAEFGHASVLQSQTPFCYLASKASPLRIHSCARFAGKLYLYVPESCRWFEIGAECGPNRIQPMELEDPKAGKVAITREVRREGQYWKVKVPPELAGGVWAAKISSAYDLRLEIGGDLPPLFALKPEWAAAIGPHMADKPGTAGKP